MAKVDVLRYDRSVTPEFLSHFVRGGCAASLREYAHARYPIDFQFRKDPKSERLWATLYVGMTAVLNVLEDKKSQALSLKAHASYMKPTFGWDESWTQPAAAETWKSRWNEVENYLERIIPEVVTGRYTKTEGVVQAAVSAYLAGSERAMLDREVTPYFEDTETKKKVQHLYSDPLAEVLADRKPAKGTPRTPFGMECDVLALDAQGHLVAVEVKPGSVGSLAWVPAQATMYARVLQHWVDHDAGWRDVIAAMFDQRKKLGLIPSRLKLPELKPTVVPAVAFQRIASAEYVRRMYAVQEALVDAGVGDLGLKFYEVSLSGRLDEHAGPV